MQLAEVKITPVYGKSIGGYSVTISAIDPTDHDCFHGEIDLPTGSQTGCWNMSGLMRDGDDKVNLAMNTSPFDDLKATAEKLSAG